MNFELLIYLIDVISSLDSINAFILFLVISIGIFFIIAFLFSWFHEDEENNIIKKIPNKIFYRYFILLFFTMFLGVFLPSEKTMYLMIGSHYLSKTEIPFKIEAVINKKLDELLKNEKDK